MNVFHYISIQFIENMLLIKFTVFKPDQHSHISSQVITMDNKEAYT